MNTDPILQGFDRYNPTVLFRGLLDGVNGHPPLLQGINLLFLLLGGIVVLWGHAMRAKNKRPSDMFDEQIRTVVCFAMMFMGGWVFANIAAGMDAVQRESGLGNSTQIATKMIDRAYSMPELVRAFDAVYAADQKQNASTPSSTPGPSPMDSLDGTWWGTTKAFFRSLWNEGMELAGKVSDLASTIWIALEKMMVYLQAFAGAMLKILIIVATIGTVHVFLLLGGAVMWVMENLRYFLLSVGAAMLPLFIGGFSLPDSNPFRRASYDYVMNMVGYCAWPLAWTIGHSVTVELYNAWVSLLAGTSRVGSGLETALKWDSASTFSERQQILQGAVADWVGGGLLQLIGLPLGALGLFFWILAVTVYGPVVLHKMLTTGASFASELSRQTGSAVAQTAGAAMTVGASAIPGAGGVATAALGGALSGAARGGMAGAFTGAGDGAIGQVRHTQQREAMLRNSESGSEGGGGGGGLAAAAAANQR